MNKERLIKNRGISWAMEHHIGLNYNGIIMPEAQNVGIKNKIRFREMHEAINLYCLTKSSYIKIVLVFACEAHNVTSHKEYLTCHIIEVYFQYIYQKQSQCQENCPQRMVTIKQKAYG